MADLEVLDILNSKNVEEWNAWRADCRQKNVYLKPDLSNIKFSRSNLCGIDFSDTILVDSVFYQTNLAKANLDRSDMTRAYLREADLSGTTFKETNLSQANLRAAKLRQVIFYKTQLYNANLQKADLTGVNLKNPELRGSRLNRLKLNDIDFSNMDLREVDFSWSYLTNVNFMNADLTGANLLKVDLDNVDFRNANLTRSHFQGARFNRRGVTFKGANLQNAYLCDIEIQNRYDNGYDSDLSGYDRDERVKDYFLNAGNITGAIYYENEAPARRMSYRTEADEDSMFGKGILGDYVDAMDLAYSGGRFDSRRRRH